MQETLLEGVRRIVFLGDSLTDGGAWMDWVVETLQANGAPDLVMHNAGVGGNKAAELRARYQQDVVALRPDLVVLHIGTNDVHGGVAIDDYRRDLMEVVAGIRAGQARVLLLTVPALADPARNQRLYAYDAVIREIGQAYGCPVVEMHAAFEQAMREGVEVLAPDGIHHGIDGWRVLARTVLAALGCQAPIIEQAALTPNALTAWQISPPLPWQGGEVPTPRAPAADWRTYDPAQMAPHLSWWEQFNLARGGIYLHADPATAAGQGAYATTVYHATGTRQELLHIGGTTPICVWLNGELIWQRTPTQWHGVHPDADRFPIALRAGDNRLTVLCTGVFFLSIGEI